jgi:hypothetical protein
MSTTNILLTVIATELFVILIAVWIAGNRVPAGKPYSITHGAHRGNAWLTA